MKSEEDEVREQDAPVGAESRHQSEPVQPLARRQQQVSDVAPVEPLAFHDERLGPRDVLRGADLDGKAEQLAVGRVLKPVVVNRRHAVAAAEYEIHEVTLSEHLSEEVRERQFGPVPGAVERPPERGLDVLAPQEQVEVLRAVSGVGVVRQGA